MAVKASPEAIRAMMRQVSQTARDLQSISTGIHQGLSATSGWNDSQAAEFHSLMQRIARLTAAPVGTLADALPKMEKLAQSLERYGSVRF